MTRFREAAFAYLKECAGTAGDFQQLANSIFEKVDIKRGGSRPKNHATTVAGWSHDLKALREEDERSFRKNWNELCNEKKDETSILSEMINKEVERLPKAAAAQEDNYVRANNKNSANEVIDPVESDDDNVVNDPLVVDNGAPNSSNTNNANEGSNVVARDDNNVNHDSLGNVAVAPDQTCWVLIISRVLLPSPTTPTLLQTTITAIMEALPSETYWMTTPDMK
jgi:hypothetical protein